MATHVLIRTQDKLSGILNANSDFTSDLSGTWDLVDTANSEIERVGNSLKVTDNSTSDSGTTFETSANVMTANTSARHYVYQLKYKVNRTTSGLIFEHVSASGGTTNQLSTDVGVEHTYDIQWSDPQGGTSELLLKVRGAAAGDSIEFDYIELREIESKGTGNFILNIEDTITAFYNSEIHTSHPINGAEGIFETATDADNALYDTPGAIIINNSPGIHTENVEVFFDADADQVMTNALILEIAKASESKSAVVDITDKLPKIVKHLELT